MPETYARVLTLQLVLHTSKATSYRIAHDIGTVHVGRRASLRVPLSAVSAHLGPEIAEAVEYEENHQAIQQRQLGVVALEPLSPARLAAVKQRAAEYLAWKARRVGDRAETGETDDHRGRHGRQPGETAETHDRHGREDGETGETDQ